MDKLAAFDSLKTIKYNQLFPEKNRRPLNKYL